MDLLNPSPSLAIPVTMWAAARVLAGAKGLTEKQALKLLSPVGLRDTKKGEASDAEPPPTGGAVQAVKALEELGLLTKVARPDDAPLLRWEGRTPRDYADFRELLLDAVMVRAHSEELGETRTPGGARDLLRGLAWILTTDPTTDTFSTNSVQRDQAASGNDDSRVFINPVRWNGFRYWAEALGFAVPALVAADGQGVVADASVAIGSVLRRTRPPGAETPARAVIDDLREQLPVLPGGAASIKLSFSPPADNRLDPATSYALLALEQSASIELLMRSDGTGTVQLAALDPNEPGRIVTHLVVRGM